jgi:tRNA(Ile)-lysidine synthase
MMQVTNKTATQILPFINSWVDPKLNIIIGCSGGADSTALSILMSKISHDWESKIKLVYVNHNLRPRNQISQEINFIIKLADDLKLDYSISEISKNEFNNIHDSSVENTARILRYEKLAKEASKFNSNIILTGHTSSDNSETILFNIIRGSGLNGLEGISNNIVKTIKSKNYKIIRPLLEIKRIQTENICKENNIKPMFDISNNDLKYTRNKIRKQILPSLEDINPKVTDALISLGKIAKRNNEGNKDLLDHLFKKIISYKGNKRTISDINTYKILPRSLRSEILRKILQINSSINIQISMKHIDKIDELMHSDGTKYYDLPNKIKFTKEYNIGCFEIEI